MTATDMDWAPLEGFAKAVHEIDPGEHETERKPNHDQPDPGRGALSSRNRADHGSHSAAERPSSRTGTQEQRQALNADYADSCVETIIACLNTPPDEHRAELEEEWWLSEVGERPAVYLAQATVGGSAWADLLAWMAWRYVSLTVRSEP